MRYLLLMGLTIVESCQSVEPKEAPATVYKYRYVRMCVCCDNLGVQIGSGMYQTRNVPAPFATDTLPVGIDSLPVWIRYQKDDSECGRIISNLIVIKSMRLR